MDNSNHENICKKCEDLGVDLIKEKCKLKSLKTLNEKLNNKLRMERQKIAKMQKEIDKLKVDNEKFNMVQNLNFIYIIFL